MHRLLLAFFLTAITLIPAGGAASSGTGSGTADARPTVAVLYFDYDGEDGELKALSKGLASMLITDMGGNAGFDVVERERMQEIIAELELSQSDLVDPAKAVQVGKLVGAQRLVFGRYFEFVGQFRIDARMVDVATGVLGCRVGSTGKRADFWDIEADMADKLSTAMLSDGKNCGQVVEGATVVSVKEARAGQTLPVTTAASYSKALDAVDSGDKDQAKTILEEVVKETPTFTLAQDELAKLLK